ncbi:hypothetical protein DM01DRAFT_1015039 [Hesseltinella vesiculosa]|uniref:C2H2-type domain-containing protein n=1 Tax=Hesseltinella vesiculosa TaxID=101127 RepID=A0A1X2GKM8_9FUNG|nr:hypothetical protein DM01DRAFT_1015039 [Hesseltinella vesiculosa]
MIDLTSTNPDVSSRAPSRSSSAPSWCGQPPSRFNSNDFLYLRQRPESGHLEENYACPCCTDHFVELGTHRNHFEITHHEFMPKAVSLNCSIVEEFDVSDIPTSAIAEKKQYGGALSKDNITFLRPDHDRLIVKDFDVSNALYQVQQSIQLYVDRGNTLSRNTFT